MASYSVYRDKYRVDAEFDKDAVIGYKHVNGEFVRLDPPIKGAWRLTATTFNGSLSVSMCRTTTREMFYALYYYDWLDDLDVDSWNENGKSTGRS